MTKIRRTRTKACDRCGQGATVLYRVKAHSDGPWQFVCDRCWPNLSTGYPNYTYGGTWKARKRH
jgi:hypothetical protein